MTNDPAEDHIGEANEMVHGNGQPGSFGLAPGSVIKTHELDALLRAAKVLDGEARTWCEGFAVKRGDHWVWNKEYEWAQLRAMHCTNAANNLRAIHKRHSSPNGRDEPRSPERT